MTKLELQQYVQNRYTPFLRKQHVDVVETDTKGAIFGRPDMNGGTYFWRFIPYADGTVGVQEGHYREDTPKTQWYEVERWPDVDSWFREEMGVTPSTKPVTARRS